MVLSQLFKRSRKKRNKNGFSRRLRRLPRFLLPAPLVHRVFFSSNQTLCSCDCCSSTPIGQRHFGARSLFSQFIRCVIAMQLYKHDSFVLLFQHPVPPLLISFSPFTLLALPPCHGQSIERVGVVSVHLCSPHHHHHHHNNLHVRRWTGEGSHDLQRLTCQADWGGNLRPAAHSLEGG